MTDRIRQTKWILICSGKVYHDACEARKEHGMDYVSIVRMEQLYPLPDIELQEALKDYADETPLYWVQEEPENMGTWPSLLHRPQSPLWPFRFEASVSS